MTRQFKATQAKREMVPMLVGLTGPSGCGKTYSALRLATGMQRITGGDIYVIDTEARRALHYADQFTFKHLELTEPFSPLDYLEAIEYCQKQGAKIIIVDSLSHEHEGPGGVLEMHDAELDRMAGKTDFAKRNKMTFTAWAKPKAQRRKLINAILRLGVNGIFCFRAKEKIKIVKGKDPIHLGWQGICGDEFLYEMTINCLLYPGSGGVPNWKPDERGEAVMLKKPAHLASVFKDGQPLSEETGERLARWAQGDAPAQQEPEDFEGLLTHLTNAPTLEILASTGKKWAKLPWTDEQKGILRATMQARQDELKSDAEVEAAWNANTPPQSKDCTS